MTGHARDTKTFNAPFGIRSLSRLEQMYNVRATGNPSSWLGPVWGISNYLVWRGLVNYGVHSDAEELAAKTVQLFGPDLDRFGTLHEYYQPENGEPILNPGFQNWNYLVLNMIEWLQDREPVAEFGMRGAQGNRTPQGSGKPGVFIWSLREPGASSLVVPEKVSGASKQAGLRAEKVRR